MTVRNFTYNFEKGHPRNISVKLLQNLTNSFREEDFLRISSCPYRASSPHSAEPWSLTEQTKSVAKCDLINPASILSETSILYTYGHMDGNNDTQMDRQPDSSIPPKNLFCRSINITNNI